MEFWLLSNLNDAGNNDAETFLAPLTLHSCWPETELLSSWKQQYTVAHRWVCQSVQIYNSFLVSRPLRHRGALFCQWGQDMTGQICEDTGSNHMLFLLLPLCLYLLQHSSFPLFLRISNCLHLHQNSWKCTCCASILSFSLFYFFHLLPAHVFYKCYTIKTDI